MKKLLASTVAVALIATPMLANATTTVAAPDFTSLTDYIVAAIPIGVAALGIGIMAALAFNIVVKIGKKITSAA